MAAKKGILECHLVAILAAILDFLNSPKVTELHQSDLAIVLAREPKSTEKHFVDSTSRFLHLATGLLYSALGSLPPAPPLRTQWLALRNIQGSCQKH